MGKFDSRKDAAAEATLALIGEVKPAKKASAPKTASTRTLAHVAARKKDGQENKTKRAELLLKPSTYEALKAEAAEDGRSLNSLINKILEAHIKEGNN